MRATSRIRTLWSALLTLTCCCHAACAEDTKGLEPYANVLNLRGLPESARDRSVNVFFDNGAWHGYALQSLPERRLGFVGPFLLGQQNGTWMSLRFADIEIVERSSGRKLEVAAASIRSSALPGRLTQSASLEGLTVRHTLIFSDARTALVRIDVHSSMARQLAMAVLGGPALGEARYATAGERVTTTFAGSPVTVSTLLSGVSAVARLDAEAGYRLELTDDVTLAADETRSFYVLQSCRLDSTETPRIPPNPVQEFGINAERWNGYLERVLQSGSPLLREAPYRRVAVKAIETLIANWRSPSGDLRHDGLFPSYSNPDFNGFWAWDSWKHAAALARFAPDLARNQIRAMLDYQDPSGMIADVIYRDRSENNWRNTKPPLAAWAVWEVYAATGDGAFLSEVLPKLIRYHRWWYEQRDHDRDGLAEYGSTDGTRIAAAWESGMDNAVRFDKARMLRNGERAWSLDQESVDLNSFLYLEKRRLAQMSRAVGDEAAAAGFEREAALLRDQVRARMFDPGTGYFYDTSIDDGAHVRVMGPEGWAPLWTGLASDGQARAVVRTMLDPRKFATYVPFPTLAADHPEFSPVQGYWRGPVWLDQAYFAIAALHHYGLRREADRMRRRLLDHAAGLRGDAPIFENYDALTGTGVQSPNFSWSAAHVLMLLAL